ncbi:hypothetical protein DL96DRAFT_1614777 [Flagelloscypha sp. PMI_526]|nr:hypothetical protein DL96DRAFT_1614777 [Flagelloscypha sp. PMI_526]
MIFMQSISTPIVTLLYGMYCILFWLAVRCLLRRGIEKRGIKVILGVNAVMFFMSTVGAGLHWSSLLIMVHELIINAGTGSLKALGPSNCTQMAMTFAQTLLGDIVVIWRVWSLCQHRRVKAILVAPWLACLGLLLTYVGWSTQGYCTNGQMYRKQFPIMVAIFSLSSFINLCVLAILLQRARPYLRQPNSTPVARVLLCLIESGSLYVITWAFEIAASVLSKNGPGDRRLSIGLETVFRYFANPGTTQLSGIYPCLIIIMLDRTVWRASEDSSSNDPLSSLMFTSHIPITEFYGVGGHSSTGPTNSNNTSESQKAEKREGLDHKLISGPEEEDVKQGSKEV